MNAAPFPAFQGVDHFLIRECWHHFGMVLKRNKFRFRMVASRTALAELFGEGFHTVSIFPSSTSSVLQSIIPGSTRRLSQRAKSGRPMAAAREATYCEQNTDLPWC